MRSAEKAPQVDGSLVPDAFYNVDGLRARGIGEWLLRRARKAGVKPHRIGRMVWYRGSDLIDWIIQSSQVKTASEWT
jgi:hypothetical protein